MYERLLVPIDGAELSERAIQKSIELAQQLGAAITGFVAEPQAPIPSEGTSPARIRDTMSAFAERGAEHANKLLARFERQARAAGVAFDGQHAQSHDVGQAIAEAALQHHCDMIVMITHGRGAFGQLLMGSHTKTVLSRSAVPLLVLH